MPEARLSVREMLNLPAGNLASEIVRAGIPDAELAPFRSALQGMPWRDVETLIYDKLAEALDVDPVQLLAAAWEKYSLLSDAAKQSKSGETVLVPMGEHAVRSELHPYVEIEIGVVKKKIELDVTLSLKLKGVIVKIEAETIRSIEAGTCEGSAEIGVAKASLWKGDIKPIHLPGSVKLGTGIPIR